MIALTAFLTDYADQAVILPVALAAAVTLAALRWWRGLLGWLLGVGGVLAAILVLKLVFWACSGLAAATGIRSPSGHTASAAVVYGGAVLLMLRGRVAPAWLALPPFGFAALFGASRLILHLHTPVDVVIGALIGVAGVAAMAWTAGPRAPARLWLLGAVGLTVAALLHGAELPVEGVIHRIALSRWLPLPASCGVG